MIRARPAVRSVPPEQTLPTVFPYVWGFVESARGWIKYRYRARVWYLKEAVT